MIADPPASAEAAVDALVGGYVEHSLHYLSKEMWRQAMAISTTQPESPFGETYAASTWRWRGRPASLLEKLQELGLLEPQGRCRSLGEVIFNNTNMNFIVFVKAEAMEMAELRAAASPPACGGAGGWRWWRRCRIPVEGI